MNPYKEDRVKSNCFKAAVMIYTQNLGKDGKFFNDNSASVIYSIAIKLFHNGIDRYWKTKSNIMYEPRFLKRVYMWFRSRFWEQKKEVDEHGKRDI